MKYLHLSKYPFLIKRIFACVTVKVALVSLRTGFFFVVFATTGVRI